MIDTANGVYCIFHFLGDVGFHLLRPGAGEHRRDRHVREVDIGKKIDIQLRIGEQSKHDKRQDHHRGEHGPFY